MGWAAGAECGTEKKGASDGQLCLQNSNPCHGCCVYPDFDILKIMC